MASFVCVYRALAAIFAAQIPVVTPFTRRLSMV